MSCGICVYASVHGSWPPLHRGTHCEDCHRSWAAKAQSHCAVCHRHFGSNSAGDVHRKRGECRDPKGFDRWETPDGPIWGGRDPVAAAKSVKAAREGSVVTQRATE